MHQVIRSYRLSKETSDAPAEWFESAITQLPGARKCLITRLVSAECSIWWYLLCSWRKDPFTDDGMEAFSCYRKSGYTSLVAIILSLSTIEVVAVHLALATINAAFAVVVTLLTVYAMLWFAGNARAVVLNPVLVGKDMAVIRWGAFFHGEIPIELIDGLGAREPVVAKAERLNLASLGGDALWIELKQPIAMRTFLGRTRTVRAVAVSPDDRNGFRRAIKERTTEASATSN